MWPVDGPMAWQRLSESPQLVSLERERVEQRQTYGSIVKWRSGSGSKSEQAILPLALAANGPCWYWYWTPPIWTPSSCASSRNVHGCTRATVHSDESTKPTSPHYTENPEDEWEVNLMLISFWSLKSRLRKLASFEKKISSLGHSDHWWVKDELIIIEIGYNRGNLFFFFFP